MASSRNDYCCVPQCKSWSRKKALSTALSFHFFPKENESKVVLETAFGRELVDRRNAWIYNLKIEKQVTKYMKVCSLHFSENDYFRKGVSENKRGILKKNAVPSKNLPCISSEGSQQEVLSESSSSSQTKKYQSSSRNDYCCVPQCNSWSRKKGLSTALSFHFFPKDNESKVYWETADGKELLDRRTAWILKLKIKKQVTKYMKVCSLHFSENDYFRKGLNENKRRILKKNAVPSKNLPRKSAASSHKKVRQGAGSSTQKKRYQSRVESKECENDSCYVKLRSEEDLQAAKALLLF